MKTVTNFASLPVEIIYKIFEYFNFDDLKAAQLVSRQWYAISQHPTTVEKSKIFIQTDIQIIRILESKRFFKNLIFGYNPVNLNSNVLEFNDLRLYSKFWKVNSENIQYVCLDGITNLNLIFQALFKLPNLKTLEFRNCQKFEDVVFDKPEKLNISSLIMGRDPQYEYMEDGEMSWILSVIPKLKKLQVTSTKMDKAILRYLRDPNCTASLNYLNLHFVDGKYEYQGDHIKTFLLKLIKIKHLNLKYLKFNYQPQLMAFYFKSSKKTEMLNFLLTQTNLETLKFEPSEIVLSNDSLLRQLPKLKTVRIEIYSESDPSQFSESLIGNLKKIWNLKVFEITFKSNSFPYQYPIFEQLNESSLLKHLHLFSISKIFKDQFISRMHFLPMLTCLRVDLCHLSDEFLQSVCKNLLSLKEFRLYELLDAPKGMTDFGLTGEIGKEDQIKEDGYSISRLTGLEILAIGSVKNSKTELSDISLKHLVKLKHLRKLCLDLKMMFSETGLSDFKSKCNAKLKLSQSNCEEGFSNNLDYKCAF